MLQASHRTTWRNRLLAAVGTASLIAALSVVPAQAISFDIDPATSEARAVAENPTTDADCPTLTTTPRSFEAWFNTDDMETRGYLDPKDQRPWSFANRIAQVICGAKTNSTIMIGMFFIRAIGTTDRPESDAEVLWRAMDYVHKKRNVSIGMVLDGGGITSAAAKSNIYKRLRDTGTANIYWCYTGCFNTNKKSTYPYALNHEKFMTISDTIWDTSGGTHPAIYSSSGNFSRSQVRTYWQEGSLIYNDVKLYQNFTARYANMKICSGSTKGSSSCRGGKFVSVGDVKPTLVKSRGIWIDSIYRHYTDADRGTTVSFSPQSKTADDYYTKQFDNVDCTVDRKVRGAMYRLTDTRAEQFVLAMKRLKGSGCDVKILLSQKGGASTISNKVAKLIKKSGLTAAVRCTAVPIHTKMILIGPSTNNSGRVLFGTANMSTSGLRYSEEHVITIDSRRASDQYREDIRRVYGIYMAGWNELNQGSKTCH
jgi:hypothetical protein